MLALLQRVTDAEVTVEGRVLGRIGNGLLVFVGVEKADRRAEADRLVQRVLGYRIFDDDRGRMNLSVIDTRGGVLLVPQFTLPADTRSGMRPSFSPAAPADAGRALFSYFLETVRARHATVASGEFGAHMSVSLTNDGPVTFLLQVSNPNAPTIEATGFGSIR